MTATTPSPKPDQESPLGVENFTAKDLTRHPRMDGIPLVPLDSPQMLDLISSIEVHGVLEPLLINDRNEVMDGWCRREAAIKAGLKEVPCRVLPNEDAPALIYTTLCNRRHLTKSAQAYLAYPLIADALVARRKRRTANLTPGGKPRTSTSWTIEETGGNHRTPTPPPHDETKEAANRENKFGRSLLFQAKQVHDVFYEDPEYKAEMEPRILSDGDDQISLQGVLAGHNGRKQTGVTPKDKGRLFRLRRSLQVARHHLHLMEKIEDEQSRSAAKGYLIETGQAFPRWAIPDVIAAMKEAYNAPQQPV